MTKRSILPIFIPFSGCPVKCIYCDQHQITGAAPFITGGDVKCIIDEGLLKTGEEIPEVAFYGGTFTMLPVSRQDELLNAVRTYIDEGCVASIRISTRPEKLKTEDFDRLKKAGVTTIEFGIQSIDGEVLRASKRGVSIVEMEKTVLLAKRNGLRIGLQQMIGLPEDTREKDLKTARWITSFADFVRIYPTVIFRNTELYDLYRQGDYRPLEMAEAVSIVAELLDYYERKEIQVIRVGLPQMSREDYIEGPYDDNFREYAESKRRVDLILESCHRVERIVGSSRAINRIVGPKGYGRDRLEKAYGPIRFQTMKNINDDDLQIIER